MCANKTNIDDTELILNGNYDAVVISLDIENNSIVGDNACIAINLFDL